MTDAGYRLIATHDVVRGYWFGNFEVANIETAAVRSSSARP